MQWLKNVAPYLSDTDVCLLHRPSTVIAHATDVLSPLLSGVTVAAAPKGANGNLLTLVDWCLQGRVTCLGASATAWEGILDAMECRRVGWPLRLGRTSASALQRTIADRWYRAFPNATLINIYGATECGSISSWRVPRPGIDRDDEPADIPVGTAQAGTNILILDDELNPVPPGTSGEVYVSSATLCLGYVGEPSLTATRFVASACGDRRMFRTGDIGYQTSAGVLHLVGRSDNQVKIRGFRVELEEVEAAIRRHYAVERACAIAHKENQSAESYIVAVVSVKGSIDLNPDDVRAFLRSRLQSQMVPATIIVVPVMPMTASGKVDRQAVRELVAERLVASASVATTSGGGGLIDRMRKIWVTAFGRGIFVDDDDDLLSIGGDSMHAVRISASVSSEFGVPVEVSDVFQHPTIEKLVAFVNNLVAQQQTNQPCSEPAKH